MSTFVVELIEEGEDVILPLPQEIIDHLGVKAGDTLVWEYTSDGLMQIKKKSVSPG